MNLNFCIEKRQVLKYVGAVPCKKIPVFLFLVVMVAITTGMALPNQVEANPFFNSPSENCNTSGTTCAAHPTWIFADDFDDGTWYTNCGQDTLDGWYGEVAGCGRTPPIPAVSPVGQGVGGTGYAAMSTELGGTGGNAAMAEAVLSGGDHAEVWFRFYIKFLPGYIFNSDQKFFDFNMASSQGAGGINYGGFGKNLSLMWFAPSADCNIDTYLNPLVDTTIQHGSWCYLNQNLHNQLVLTTGRWYYLEIHFIMNTFGVRNGTAELWLNDCGTTGTSCGAAPIKRSSYNNVQWAGGPFPGGTGPGLFDFDIWGNPADNGTM